MQEKNIITITRNSKLDKSAMFRQYARNALARTVNEIASYSAWFCDEFDKAANAR